MLSGDSTHHLIASRKHRLEYTPDNIFKVKTSSIICPPMLINLLRRDFRSKGEGAVKKKMGGISSATHS